MSAVMGTAGHIDHGKTSLVRALTGIDCDRLEEEKRRGITIELGFAHWRLPDGSELGIVDVPGHEKFVRNMVAGASGIDFVLLVVAADEGVMPQTREHLEICSLLGIRYGLVALTKIDMVDADLRRLAEEDVRAELSGTFLEKAPILPVSAVTGEGLGDLAQAIASLAAGLAPHRRTDLFRLPVDRVFTLKGHGTVVTGTQLSGVLKVGEALEVFPSGRQTRARTLQQHGRQAETTVPGSRVAINLYGLEVDDVHRGDVLARPETLFPADRWLLRVSCLASSPRPLRHRGEIHFHHGARETAARLHFFDRDRLAPGETALAEIRLAEPLVAVFGDRCVIRGLSPLRTLAGGVVLNPLGVPFRRRELTPDLAQRLLALPESDAATRLREQTLLAGMRGVTGASLSVLTNLDARQREKALQPLLGKTIVCFDRERQGLVALEPLRELEESCLNQVEAAHRREPLRPSLPRGVAAEGWSEGLSPKLAHAVLERLLRAGRLVAEGDGVRLATHAVALNASQSDIRARLLEIYKTAGLTPPSLREAEEQLDMAASADSRQLGDVFKMLLSEGELVKLREGLYAASGAVEDLKTRIRAWFADHDNLDPAALRDISGGLSRKYLIAYLEYFDRERFTLRVGDVRRLRG
ncbi:MAG TPA: selenocysteine-specific translation elongation factor [Candidatus Avidesulfovibrio excrementigallinarum]|nr:selenocysteine-specific translation elongation factor [Candidatus Avidesulfovibrio excrementigallinarum]